MEFLKLRGLTSDLLIALEVLVFCGAILATRCANFRDVFVGGAIYFADADCYSRMSRAQICFKHPTTILRYHSFENFPAGTVPHTTAPFDYLIVALAKILRLFSDNPLELAGAMISPLLALCGGVALWIWLRKFRWRERFSALFVYATSPILVHGAELGRPDHQSLLIALLTIALCAEWRMQMLPSRVIGIMAGAAWGLALWTSLYEPLILFCLAFAVIALREKKQLWSSGRRDEWITLICIILLATFVERRLPEIPWWSANSFAANWAATIGELSLVKTSDPIWLRWAGCFIFALPAISWLGARKKISVEFSVLALATFLLTCWQARWSYFFVLIVAICLPTTIREIRSRTLAVAVIVVGCWPILQDWDERLWPNESQLAARLEQRNEQIALRAAAMQLRGEEQQPFLSPWWLSPAIAFWSGQPGVAGSSHEALPGIIDSARFFATADTALAQRILQDHRVAWLVVYDADRTLQNSRAILGESTPADSLAAVLDSTPSRSPTFAGLEFQNRACKIFRVQISAKN